MESKKLKKIEKYIKERTKQFKYFCLNSMYFYEIDEEVILILNEVINKFKIKINISVDYDNQIEVYLYK